MPPECDVKTGLAIRGVDAQNNRSGSMDAVENWLNKAGVL